MTKEMNENNIINYLIKKSMDRGEMLARDDGLREASMSRARVMTKNVGL